MSTGHDELGAHNRELIAWAKRLGVSDMSLADLREVAALGGIECMNTRGAVDSAIMGLAASRIAHLARELESMAIRLGKAKDERDQQADRAARAEGALFHHERECELYAGGVI
jgi:hypothetical protein